MDHDVLSPRVTRVPDRTAFPRRLLPEDVI
jgi:hypothetical protein